MSSDSHCDVQRVGWLADESPYLSAFVALALRGGSHTTAPSRVLRTGCSRLAPRARRHLHELSRLPSATHGSATSTAVFESEPEYLLNESYPDEDLRRLVALTGA